MTTTKTIPLELTGQSLIDAKAKLWFLSLRLWMHKHQPHLRARPSYPIHPYVEIEFEDIHGYAICYKHVYCIPVWNIDCDKIVCYYLYTNDGSWLGRITHLRYLESAS